MDLFKTYNLTLDIVRDSRAQLLQVNTNDMQTIKIAMTVTHHGEPIDLSGKTARIAVLKPDKKTVFQDCEITDAKNGKCEVILTTQAYLLRGIHYAELMIYEGDAVAVSSRFTYKANKGILNDEAVESTDEWQSINQAIENAEGILNDLRENGTGVDAQARSELQTVNALLAQTPTINEVRRNTFLQPINVVEFDTETKALFTGGNVAVVGENAVGEENVKPKAIKPSKTSFLKIGKNLFDKNSVTLGHFPSNLHGGLVVSSGYDASDWISVIPNSNYSRKYNNHIAYYDINKVFISGSVNSGLTFTTPGNCYFIRVSTLSNNSLKDREQIELGTQSTIYEEYKHTLTSSSSSKIQLEKNNIPVGFIEKDMLQDRIIDTDKVDFLKKLPNLIDKKALSFNELLDNDGTTVTSTLYDTSDYIKVLKGETATFHNGLRKLMVYNIGKTFISVEVNADLSNSTYTFTATDDCFIRGSWLKRFTPTIVLNYGNTADTNKSEYGFVIDEEKIKLPSNSAGTVTDYKLKVTKNGEEFYIRSSFSENQDIIINVTRSGSANGSFNFLSTQLVNKAGKAGLEGYIHQNTDDITPIRLSWNTIGANHGYVRIISVNLVGHNKKTADLGSIWSDGVTEYTLLKIEGNNLILGCPYTVSNGIVSASTINPIANLTHVSGATNTSAISIATLNSAPQLFPSINKQSCDFVLDDFIIKVDGDYYGNELQVKEQYNIMSYKGIIDYAQSHIGQSYANDDVAGAVRIGINYTFAEGGKCTISHTLKALERLSLGQCGFLQSVVLTPLSGTTIKRYMPNVLEKSGINFKNTVDMTSYNTSLVFGTSDLINPAIPPSRYTDLIVDGSGNNLIGYSMGYVIDKTKSKHADRLANTSLYWDMRNTKKSYPIALNGKTFEIGDYFNIMGYRNYLHLSDKQATNINIVEDKKDTYVYIDYHENVTSESLIMDNRIGKSIEVIESENFTLHNDVVDAEGVTFSINSGYGYGILKVS